MSDFLRPSKKSLKNAQHFELIDAFLKVISEAGLPSAKVTALVSQLQTAFQEEDRWFMVARASEIIAQRRAADKRRDDLYRRLHAIIRAWAGSGMAMLDDAGTELIKVFTLYKLNTSAQLDEESGHMENLITDISTPEMQTHLATLNCSWLFQQMVEAHELVKSLRLEQGIERSQKVTGALKKARAACDHLYDKVTYLIEAASLVADDPTPYDEFIKKWNGTLKITAI